ncbi:MAG: sigma-70 family RNA polymerase sigma factor [Candidatus Levybacteria bacterium]|nr:sigma-70 family RNA polymerase sigma factor [Candidatus Levybacteria bacterium]
MSSQLTFESLYLKYSDRIYRYVYLNLNDPYLSEDITSEVFLRVWKRWSKIRQDFIQALLYKIARNIIVDHYRKKKNKRQISLEESVERGIEPFYEQEFIEKIHKDNNIQRLNAQIKLLPANLRDVLILRFVDDLSAKEVGEIMKISEVNVRVLQYRAIKKLKEVIKNE